MSVCLSLSALVKDSLDDLQAVNPLNTLEFAFEMCQAEMKVALASMVES